MKETSRIVDQLRRAFEKDAWHGPSVREVLAGVTAAQAAARPIAAAHTIWELVHHIASWEAVVCRRLQGERVDDLPPAEDWPPVTDAGEEAWRRTLDRLTRGHHRLRRLVATLPDSRLSKIVPGKRYTFYVMLHGIVQHDLYHAGQVALLKRALG